MAQEFLYGSNIVAGLKQVRGEGMPEGVARGPLRQARLRNGISDGLLNPDLSRKDREGRKGRQDMISPLMGPYQNVPTELPDFRENTPPALACLAAWQENGNVWAEQGIRRCDDGLAPWSMNRFTQCR